MMETIRSQRVANESMSGNTLCFHTGRKGAGKGVTNVRFFLRGGDPERSRCRESPLGRCCIPVPSGTIVGKTDGLRIYSWLCSIFHFSPSLPTWILDSCGVLACVLTISFCLLWAGSLFFITTKVTLTGSQTVTNAGKAQAKNWSP